MAKTNKKTTAQKFADDTIYETNNKFLATLAKASGAKYDEDDDQFIWPALKEGKFTGYMPHLSWHSVSVQNGMGIRVNADNGRGYSASANYETRKTADATCRMITSLAKRCNFPALTTESMCALTHNLYNAMERRRDKAEKARAIVGEYQQAIAAFLGTSNTYVEPTVDEDDQFLGHDTNMVIKFYFWASKQRMQTIQKFLESSGIVSSFYTTGGNSRRLTIIVREDTVLKQPTPSKAMIAAKRKNDRLVEIKDIAQQIELAASLVKIGKLPEASQMLSDQLLRMSALKLRAPVKTKK